MALTVKTGLNAPKDFLDSVFALEKIVYPPDLWGKKENLQSRYEKNNESYILIYDDEKLAGYINFFPISDRIDNDLLNYESQKMWDDDITADDITPWEDANNVFILSVVTAPEYRDGEAIILLGNAFTNFICEKCANGKKIISISGAAVSEGGENFLTRYRAEFFKPLEHGYKYYRTDAVNIAEFIKNKTYKKSYSDDLYFFIPMTSNQIDGTNEKIKQAHDAAIKKFGLYENHFGTIYREAIDSHVDYECNSNTLSLENLKRFYLGEFQFACYNDDYDKKILQTETCHLFISAHSKTGLYIITAAIPNNEYLPTQLIDQMSAGHLDIICPPKEVPLQKEGTVFLDKDKKHSCISIKNYIGNRFDLSICGDPKFVMCLSNMPENPAELAYALAGETYNSEHIDYRILDKHINDLISHNHSSYNYYDSYISSSGIAFILRDFSSNIVKRIEKYEASVLFVVEFVLLQNTAVLRTNRNVIRQLENSDKITNEDIENLYIEFGKTQKFWNSDIYKYPFTQREANQVIEAFGISKTIDEYHRNQQYLDRLIELQSKITEQRSASRTNAILFTLSAVEGSAVTLGGLLWILKNILDKSLPIYPIIEDITRVAWPILFVAFLILLSSKLFISRRKKKK